MSGRRLSASLARPAGGCARPDSATNSASNATVTGIAGGRTARIARSRGGGGQRPVVPVHNSDRRASGGFGHRQVPRTRARARTLAPSASPWQCTHWRCAHTHCCALPSAGTLWGCGPNTGVMFVCMYVCMYACMCVCVCVYVCMHVCSTGVAGLAPAAQERCRKRAWMCVDDTRIKKMYTRIYQ